MLRQRPASTDGFAPPATRVGDTLVALAKKYAAKMNASAFGTALRERRLERDRYLGYVTAMYPNVVGFNRALIRGIAKVDHVRRSAFVKALAEQLQEEQSHNELWRRKLEAYGVDHDAVYRTLSDYLTRFSAEQLERMTMRVVEALTADEANTAPGAFPEPPFPEPVLALYHQLWMTASRDDVDHWEHFASQSGMEFIIFDVVSTSIYPGVAGNPELDGGPVTLQWWREHAKQGSIQPGVRSDEEKHLELAQIVLNRHEFTPELHARIATTVENTMRLFAATMSWHDRHTFPTDRFRLRAAA